MNFANPWLRSSGPPISSRRRQRCRWRCSLRPTSASCGVRKAPQGTRRTMALFNDGPISSIEDLTGQDLQLLEVARVESIDVTRKLLQAHVDLAVALSTMLSIQNNASSLGSVE